MNENRREEKYESDDKMILLPSGKKIHFHEFVYFHFHSFTYSTSLECSESEKNEIIWKLQQGAAN